MIKNILKNKELVGQFICLILLSVLLISTSQLLGNSAVTVSNKKSTVVNSKLRNKVAAYKEKEVSNKYSILNTPFSIKNLPTPIPTIIPTPTVQPKQSIEEYYAINADTLNVRNTPSLKGDIIGKYYTNDVVKVVDKQGDWYKTEDGYIFAAYLVSSGKPNVIARVPLSRGGDSPIPKSELNFSLDVINKSNITLEQLSSLTNNTGLKGIENAIIEVEDKYEINAFFTLAVARLESANGNARLARDKNNLFGINAVDSDPYRKAFSYDTKSDCVQAFGNIVKNNYVNKGLDTPGKINPIYCPTNDTWSSQVITIMKEEYRMLKK